MSHLTLCLCLFVDLCVFSLFVYVGSKAQRYFKKGVIRLCVTMRYEGGIEKALNFALRMFLIGIDCCLSGLKL